MPIDRSGGANASLYAICTNATRPGSPVEGQVIYETDTNLSYYYDGAAWRLNGIQVVGHTVLGGSATTISYTLPTITNGLHLIVDVLFQSDTSGIDCALQPNADNTGANYFRQMFYGQNATAVASQNAGAVAGARMGNADNGSTYWAGATAWIFDYASSKQKSLQTLWGTPYALGTSAHTLMEHCIWKSTSAITSLTLRAGNSANFRSGSMMSVKVVGSV